MACLAGAALAGSRPPGSPTGFDHPPTNDEIRSRLNDICTSLVETQDQKSPAVAGRRCGCYSSGVVKAMTPSELDEMRATGKFSPSAQPKAEHYMRSCHVKT
jgi:hypothetical protein